MHAGMGESGTPQGLLEPEVLLVKPPDLVTRAERK